MKNDNNSIKQLDNITDQTIDAEIEEMSDKNAKDWGLWGLIGGGVVELCFATFSPDAEVLTIIGNYIKGAFLYVLPVVAVAYGVVKICSSKYYNLHRDGIRHKLQSQFKEGLEDCKHIIPNRALDKVTEPLYEWLFKGAGKDRPSHLALRSSSNTANDRKDAQIREFRELVEQRHRLEKEIKAKEEKSPSSRELKEVKSEARKTYERLCQRIEERQNQLVRQNFHSASPSDLLLVGDDFSFSASAMSSSTYSYTLFSTSCSSLKSGSSSSGSSLSIPKLIG